MEQRIREKNERKIRDLDNLDELNIAYFSMKLDAQKKNNKWMRDENGRLKKTPSKILNYRNIKIETHRDNDLNSTMIPLGSEYNLIGIDVDNKNDTVKQFNKIMNKKGEIDTLQIKTMNDGYHLYYHLNKQQEKTLKKLKFKSKNDALFDLNIDVKYDNQVFFGPTVIAADKVYNYKIINATSPSELPDYLFDELVHNLTKKQKTRVKKMKKELDEEESEEDKSEEEDESEEDKRLRRYLNCIDKKRWDKYEDWFILGSVIYNEEGSLDIFKEYSKISDKYEKKACEKKWKEYGKNRGEKITIATLIQMGKEDSPKECIRAQQEDIEHILFKIMKHGITDKLASELFYYWNNNIIYDETNKSWYVLNKYNIWNQDPKGYEVHKMIGNFLEKKFNKAAKKIINKKIEQEEKDRLLKNWSKAVKYVTNNKTKKNILDELICYYKRDKIYDKMDNVNNYLFAFNNGVYDLKENTFRLPLPEELITITCGYDYESTYDKNIKRDLLNTLNEMFEAKEDRDYILSTIAQCLSGVPFKEKFYVWRGQGRNGKGVLRDLAKYTFGSYFSSMDINYLNKTKHGCSATAADEVMATKKNSRIVMTTEPESSMEIKTGKLKQWSGRDPVDCRGLYGKNFTFVPKFKVFIQSNFDLSFGGAKVKAMMERNEVYEFPFSFVPNPVNPNEKPEDVDLKERIENPKYKIAFFHVLLRYYKRIINNNKIINVPKSVKDQTEIFSLASDPFTPFFNDVIKKTGDTKKYLKSNELMIAFNKYHNDPMTRMNAQEFKAALIGVGLKPSALNGCVVWRGIEFNKEFNKNCDIEL